MQQFINAWRSTITDVGGINASATSITVEAGDGAALAAVSSAISAGLPVFLTFDADENDPESVKEIVKVTARATDTLTIERAQDGTTGQIWASGSLIELRVIARELRHFNCPDPSICNGRLTLATGVAIPTTDQTAKTTVYWTPHKGNRIALYDGTNWQLIASAEVSIALGTLTADKNYDVFGYLNAGALALELSAAWTSDSARADALTTQDGILVKDGALTRRYLGTFRTISTTETEDSAAKRLLWNMYNRVDRKMVKKDTTNSWAYSTATLRQANGSTANQVSLVVGQAEDPVHVAIYSAAANSTTTTRTVFSGIGINSTSVNSAEIFMFDNCNNAFIGHPQADIRAIPALGYSYYAWLEAGAGADTQTWYGDNGTTTTQSGMIGTVRA